MSRGDGRDSLIVSVDETKFLQLKNKMLVKNIWNVQPARLLGINVRFTSSNFADSQLILTKEINDKGLLILNRPNALNATTFEMIEHIADTLKQWQDTKSLIVVRGNGV